MNSECLVELMESLKEFNEYTYYRNDSCFYFTDLNSKQFMKLYNIILKYNLTFKIDKGLKVWV